jgi:NitT/TauT family transport system permease protein
MTFLGWRVPMLASLLVWAVLWEIVGRLDLVFLLPPLSDVLAAAATLVQTPTWQAATLVTARSFAAGLGLAILVGVPLGVAMGRIEPLDRLLGMWVDLFVSAPLTALVPVLMILFGFGDTTVIITVFLFAVWIIALDTRAGVRHVPASLVEMGACYGASPRQMLTKIILKAALPEILAGIRLGVIRAVKGVVIGQLLVAIVGYGELFELYSRGFAMTSFWALTLILFAMAMLLSALVEAAEKRVEFYAGVRQ